MKMEQCRDMAEKAPRRLSLVGEFFFYCPYWRKTYFMLKLSLLTAFCTSLSSLVFAVNMAVDSSSSKHSPRLGGHWGHSLCCAMSGVEACAVEGGCGSSEARVCCPGALAVPLDSKGFTQ